MNNMSKLTFDLLSDTHNQHHKFTCPGGDFLLHSGDCTGRGTSIEVQSFMLWMEIQPYKHKVVIPGNHDWDLEKNFPYWKDEFAKRGIHLLNDSGLELEGIKIWGSPVQPWFYSWAFNRARTEGEATRAHPWIKPHWDMIPEDTELLLTHGPPMGILDQVMRLNRSEHEVEHVGCEELYRRIQNTQVKLHVFGHIHEGRGWLYEGPTTYINASSLNDMYSPFDLSNPRPMRVIREVFQDGSVGYVV